MIQLEKPIRNVFHLKFESRDIMYASLLRPFEADNFNGRAPALQEIIAYNVRKTGRFDFFNSRLYALVFPGTNLIPFYCGKCDPLSFFEKRALHLLRNMEYEFGYIIGTFRDRDTRHELADLLFLTDRTYRQKVRKILETISVKNRLKFERNLEKRRYSQDEYEREINSYLIEGILKCVQTPRLRHLFKEHLKKHRNGSNGNGRR